MAMIITGNHHQMAEVPTDYSPIPFMEVHGLLDEIVHYATTAPTAPVFGPEKALYRTMKRVGLISIVVKALLMGHSD